jgi:pimeloyl-ACP methyl ester carboxylesterase
LFIRGWGEPGARPVLYWHGVNIRGRASMAINEAGPLLAEHGLRILAFDAPGFGSSPALERSAYHPHALAGLVPQLLDALGIVRAPLVGFSWGGDIGCHVGARHADRLTALVILDAGYRDPPFDPSRPFEEYVAENEAAFEEYSATSWDEVFAEARERHRRWSAKVEASVRAWRREQAGRIVPAGDPRVIAAVEHGIAQALPSTTRAALAEGGLPVLLVASDDADEEDLGRFEAEVPQAEIHRPGGVGHDVLVDGYPNVVHFVGEWLERRSQLGRPVVGDADPPEDRIRMHADLGPLRARRDVDLSPAEEGDPTACDTRASRHGDLGASQDRDDRE